MTGPSARELLERAWMQQRNACMAGGIEDLDKVPAGLELLARADAQPRLVGLEKWVRHLGEYRHWAVANLVAFGSDIPVAPMAGCTDSECQAILAALATATDPSAGAHVHDFRTFNDQTAPPRRVCINKPCPGGFNIDPEASAGAVERCGHEYDDGTACEQLSKRRWHGNHWFGQ